MDQPTQQRLLDLDEETLYLRAAEWLDAMSDGPLDEVSARRFMHWLHSTPECRVIFERMLETWANPELTEAVSQTLRGVPGASNTANFFTRCTRWHAPLWFGAVACGLVIFAVMMSVKFSQATPPLDAALSINTAIAQTRDQALADGSLLEIGAAASIEVAYKPDQRLVHLHQGAAYFTVAADKQRPFAVFIGPASVIAVGTQFNIDKTANGVDVTVYEGAVEVRGSATQAPQLLRAGERVRITKDGLATVEAVALAQLVDWRSGWVDLADESLGYLLEQLNRHSETAIELAEPGLAQLRVAGRFRLRDTDATLALLAELHHLDIHRNAGRTLVQRMPTSPD